MPNPLRPASAAAAATKNASFMTSSCFPDARVRGGGAEKTFGPRYGPPRLRTHAGTFGDLNVCGRHLVPRANGGGPKSMNAPPGAASQGPTGISLPTKTGGP